VEKALRRAVTEIKFGGVIMKKSMESGPAEVTVEDSSEEGIGPCRDRDQVKSRLRKKSVERKN
jgi:hypothetical protein